MKTRLIFGIFALLLALNSFGCKTPEPVIKYEDREVIREVQVQAPPETLVPLTPYVLRRLHESDNGFNLDNDNIKKIQLLLFGRLVLEREDVQQMVDLLDDGTVRFENKQVLENITINDQTEGLAMSIETTREREIILSVCFEENTENLLTFSAPSNNPNSYFYLKYTPSTGDTDEYRGNISFNDKSYKVKFAGNTPPYLLIRLKQENSDTPPRIRNLPGRRVR